MFFHVFYVGEINYSNRQVYTKNLMHERYILFFVACFRSKYVSRVGFRGCQLPHRSQPADHQREWDVIALRRVPDVDERAFHRKPLKLLTQCQQNVISDFNPKFVEPHGLQLRGKHDASILSRILWGFWY